MFVVQVTVFSPLSWHPSVQLRDRTVPVETGNCLSASILVQVVFRPVQSEMLRLAQYSRDISVKILYLNIQIPDFFLSNTYFNSDTPTATYYTQV